MSQNSTENVTGSKRAAAVRASWLKLASLTGGRLNVMNLKNVSGNGGAEQVIERRRSPRHGFQRGVMRCHGLHVGAVWRCRLPVCVSISWNWCQGLLKLSSVGSWGRSNGKPGCVARPRRLSAKSREILRRAPIVFQVVRDAGVDARGVSNLMVGILFYLWSSDRVDEFVASTPAPVHSTQRIFSAFEPAGYLSRAEKSSFSLIVRSDEGLAHGSSNQRPLNT